jgi:hypothetical protein
MAPELVEEILKPNSNYTYSTSNKFYQCVQVSKFKSNSGKEAGVTVSCIPTHPSISSLRIELNPSKLDSFSELLALTSAFDVPENLILSRIDHAVDLNYPIQDIYKGILNTRKRLRTEYAQGKDLTGFYLGNRPEMLTVYDRQFKDKLKDPCTRVELRQWNNKRPVPNLANLPELKGINVYRDIKFWKLKAPDSIEHGRREKYKLLYNEIEFYGAMGAYKRLNVQWNFKRDFGNHFFEENAGMPSLNQLYQAELNIFFNGGFQSGIIKAG